MRQRLRRTVRDLAEGIGPRPPGSAAERRAADYLKRRFEQIGYTARIETFRSPSHRALSSQVQVSGIQRPFVSLPAQHTAPGRVRGDLLFLGNCAIDPLALPDGAGKVGLLVPSEDIATRVRLLRALERRGMAAVIAVSPYPDTILTKVFRYPEIKRMPVVIVSYQTACRLRRHEGRRVEIVVHGERQQRTASQNVVAELPGTGRHWLAVGSHYDTAAFSPGATDNAGGVAAVLEVARLLHETRPAATVVFLLTGSEEFGGDDMVGRGARAFFRKRARRVQDCIAYIDTDDMGNVLGTPALAIAGPARFRDAVLNAGLNQTYQVSGKANLGCDHGAAEQYGVPYAWFGDARTSGARPYYHSPADTMQYLDLARLAAYVPDIRAAAEALGSCAPFHPVVEHDGWRVRQARFGDLAAIGEITRLAFGPYSVDRMREDIFGEPLGGKVWYEHKCGSTVAQCRAHIYYVIVAEADGRVIGYATYGPDPARGLASVGNNAVHPSWQGRGVATSLQREIRRRMIEEGYTRFEVTTLSNDIPAQHVYARLGFEKYIESCHYLAKHEALPAEDGPKPACKPVRPPAIAGGDANARKLRVRFRRQLGT